MIRRTVLKKLANILVVVILISISDCNYVSANSATAIVKTIEKKMMESSRSTFTFTETLVATIFSLPATVALETEKVEMQKTVVPKKPLNSTKKSVVATETKSTQKSKKEYISIKEYKEKMNINMDISHPSGLSKKDFVKLATKIVQKLPEGKDPKGIFKEYASFIWKLGEKKAVDQVFLLGIAAKESGWCEYYLAIERNNFTGHLTKEGKLISYKTVQDNWKATAKNLRENYFNKGRKDLLSVNELYCEPDENGEYTWYTEVYECMKMIVS